MEMIQKERMEAIRMRQEFQEELKKLVVENEALKGGANEAFLAEVIR